MTIFNICIPCCEDSPLQLTSRLSSKPSYGMTEGQHFYGNSCSSRGISSWPRQLMISNRLATLC